MKFKKTFLVLTTLFILLGTNLALAVSDLPDDEAPAVPGTEESGDSGDTSGDATPSGDPSDDTSGDPSDDADILKSTANDSSFSIDKNGTLTAAMEATTSGDETFSFVIITNTAHGSLTHEDSTSPSFSYKPETDYVGSDSFTFRLESGDSYSNVGTVSITIKGEDKVVIPFYYEDMQSHWANYSASHLAARGLIIGEEINNDFYYFPDRGMTRAEFILFLLSIVDDHSSTPVSADDDNVTFADASSIPTWLLEKAELAYELGIISGVGSSNSVYLYPDRNITRSEAFVMINNVLTRAEATSSSNTKLDYSDESSIPSWALSSIKNLTGYKIIQGTTGGAIRANAYLSRGEASELSYKLLKQLESLELPVDLEEVNPEDVK